MRHVARRVAAVRRQSVRRLLSLQLAPTPSLRLIHIAGRQRHADAIARTAAGTRRNPVGLTVRLAGVA